MELINVNSLSLKTAESYPKTFNPYIKIEFTSSYGVMIREHKSRKHIPNDLWSMLEFNNWLLDTEIRDIIEYFPTLIISPAIINYPKSENIIFGYSFPACTYVNSIDFTRKLKLETLEFNRSCMKMYGGFGIVKMFLLYLMRGEKNGSLPYIPREIVEIILRYCGFITKSHKIFCSFEFFSK